MLGKGRGRRKYPSGAKFCADGETEPSYGSTQDLMPGKNVDEIMSADVGSGGIPFVTKGRIAALDTHRRE